MVSMATELGEGVDVIRLLRMSWEDRLKVIVNVHTRMRRPVYGAHLNKYS